jgi:RNA polymerase II elongation factor ELL
VRIVRLLQLFTGPALSRQDETNNITHNRLTVSTPEMRALKGAASKAKSRASHLKPLLANSARSLPGSPAMGASSPYLAPPPSAGLDSPHQMAVRRALAHFLAVKPQSEEICQRTVRDQLVHRLIEKVAKQTGDDWTLQDKMYKELDVWNFNYKTQEDRQAAIDNAIRAYDRMRLSKDDELWQKLLPEEERGQGKVLSRLNLNTAPVKASTPAVKPKTFDKKTGMPKRTEAKKTDKESTKSKKTKDNKEGDVIRVAKSKTEARTPKPGNTPRPDNTREKKGIKKEANPVRKEVKASTAAKSLLNKPKNPSPLSASPPVNATDFEDDHPVHKALSAAVSPKRAGTPRKVEERISEAHRPNGIKRKAFDMDSDNSKTSTPTKVRKVNGNINGMTNGHRSPQSDNSSGSPPLALSWRQSLELAKKFRTYYEKYAKLYTELSNSVEPPSQAKRDQLLNMHRKLEEMKKEVRSGAL